MFTKQQNRSDVHQYYAARLSTIFLIKLESRFVFFKGFLGSKLLAMILRIFTKLISALLDQISKFAEFYMQLHYIYHISLLFSG